MKHIIHVKRDKKDLGHSESRRLILNAVPAVLEAEGIACLCEVSFLLTDDIGIRALNRDFRNIDSETDVLSFPGQDLEPGNFNADSSFIDPISGAIFLGDIAISLERCNRQADEYGSTFQNELEYLTIHSILHLLGYDHVDEGAKKAEMRAREKTIISEMKKQTEGK